MADLAEVSCAIIAAVGAAKGCFVEAIRCGKTGELEAARNAYAEGVSNFHIGHKAHHELITQFAQGEDIHVDILLVHAECQMMSAEDFMVISSEVIDYLEVKANPQ